MKQKYRKGVGIFLINKRNQLWVGKRLDYKNEYWQMPQGGIDGAESPENAMKRELMEETGLNKSYKIISKTSSWILGCSTKVFNNFNDLKIHLLEKYESK